MKASASSAWHRRYQQLSISGRKQAGISSHPQQWKKKASET